MKKQRVDTYAEAEVLNGKSHQEIYDHVVATSQFKIHDVAEIVRKIPTLEKRKKYHSLNTILLAVIGLAILDRVFLTFREIASNGHFNLAAVLLFPIIGLVLFYAIYKFKRNAHLSAGFILSLGTFMAFFRLPGQPDIFSMINIIINLLGAFLAFYLSVKLVSDYTLDHEQQKNNPEQRKNLITFKD